MAPNGQVSLRAIVQEGLPCPAVTVDQQAKPMQLRAAGNAQQAQAPDKNRAFDPPFAVASCQLDLPAASQEVLLAGQPLAMPKAQAQRIVLLGDTGCRIKMPANGKGDPIQDCTSQYAWPWARIASAAAREKPDLIIHVGDYHYREFCDDPGAVGFRTRQSRKLRPGRRGLDAFPFAVTLPAMLRSAFQNGYALGAWQ